MHRVLAVSFAVFAFTLVAAGQDTSVQLRVLLPQDDAKVFIDGKLTEQKKGETRLYLSPPLGAGTFSYNVTAKWWPNNYTEVIRTRTVNFKPGATVDVDLRQEDP